MTYHRQLSAFRDAGEKLHWSSSGFPFDFDQYTANTAPADFLTSLSVLLGPDWEVAREIDYLGDISIIALPSHDIDAMPALILYEKNGQAHFATVNGVDWETDRAFPSFRHATSAMVAKATALVGASQIPGAK